MRIWDISVKKLCNKHLVAEHNELHVIWSVITKNKKGYSRHPETMRWRGKLKALYGRHEQQIKEMKARGYVHKSPLLNKKLATGKAKQTQRVNTVREQISLLRKKKCKCKVK